MTFKSILLAGALALAATGAQAATLVNGGFEAGDTSGWTATPGYVEVVTETDDAIVDPMFGGEHFTPVEGAYFAKLTAGADLGVYTVLSQVIDLATASKISGSAAFLAFDYLPYDDDAFVRIVSATTNDVVFQSSVTVVGDYGHTTWTSFTSTTLVAGTYLIEAGVRDNVDFGGSSQLLLDGFKVAAVGDPGGVPEPATWTMMIAGFMGVGAVLRTRRRLEGAARPAA